MNKYSALVLLIAASLSSVASRAQPISSEDVDKLDTTAHTVERALQIAGINTHVQKQSVCQSIGQLNSLSNDLIMEKSVPDETSSKSLSKLLEFSQTTEDLLNYCTFANSKNVDRYQISKKSLELMETKVYPALTAFKQSLDAPSLMAQAADPAPAAPAADLVLALTPAPDAKQ